MMEPTYNLSVTQNQKIYNVVVTQNLRRFSVTVNNNVNQIQVENYSLQNGTIITGANGKSAYELWLEAGNTGTLSDFLESLGGIPGLSAFQVWLLNGNTGTVDDFLDFLRGPQGYSAFQLAQQSGFSGDLSEWLLSLKGDQGDSAFQVAVNNGYVGDEASWLETLHGDNGDNGNDGLSAYELAVINGYVGDEPSWLASLEGSDGDNGRSAYELALLNGFVGTEPEYLESLKANNDLEDARSRDNTIAGPINANGNTIENLSNAANPQEPVTLSQLQAAELTWKAYADAIGAIGFRLLGDFDIVAAASYPAPGIGSGTSGAIRRGDAFRLIGITGSYTLDGVSYQNGDILYAIATTPGQNPNNWASLDWNQQQAIETQAGVAKICTLAEIQDENTTNNTDIVTPVKWWGAWTRARQLAWTFVSKITFTSAPRFSSMTAGAIMKVDGSKDLVPATAGTDYLAPQVAITGATKTKVTYGSNGLVTGGSDATTDDIAEGLSRLYFTTTRVLATVLSGLSLATGGTISSADTILAALGKLQYQISNLFDSTVWGAAIQALTAKATPVDADSFVVSDSGDSNKTKRVLLSALKSYMQAAFDLIYQAKASWTDYSTLSTITGFSAYTTKNIRYLTENKKLNMFVALVGTSTTGATSITMPANASNTQVFTCYVRNNSGVSGLVGRVVITAGSNVATFSIDIAGTAFTTSGTKEVNAAFSFEIP